jgi:hypothetical protein
LGERQGQHLEGIHMNRFKQFTAAAAVCAIAFPAFAAASTTKYAGDMDQGGTVKFTLEKHGADRAVLKFKADNVKATCDEGTGRLFGHINVPLEVSDTGNFEFHYSSAGNSADLLGKIKPNGRASGTWEQTFAGTDQDEIHNCVAPERDWRAKKI